MRKFVLLLTALFVATLAFAQSDQQTPPAQTQPQTQDQQQTPPPDQSKKKDKKKKNQDDPLSTEEFSDRVANNVMKDLKDGLEGHMQRLLISSFDENEMDGYLQLQDQIENFFNKYEAIRIHYRIIQNTVEAPNKAVVLVDMQMEATPAQNHGSSLRRDEQIRFELERGKKGWKIIDFQPRDFFM